MNTEVNASGRSTGLVGLQKYGMLLMGIFLVILSGGRFVTPSAAFLAPIFILRFTRNSPLKSGLAILYVLLFLSLLVRLHDYLAVARPLNLLLIAGIAVLELLPFVADRTLREYLPTFLRPLVLPSVFVVLGFVFSSLLPFGSMGERAYSQSGNNELLQLLAVTGTHGVTFVIFWFAATMASLWDSGFIWQRNRSQVAPLALCLMIVFVAGGFRTIFDENESPTVRIAGVITSQTELAQALKDAGVSDQLNGLTTAGYDVAKVTKALDHNLATLITQTKQAAAAGAPIVVWSEAGAVIFKNQLAETEASLAALAATQKLYLAATLRVAAEPGTTTDLLEKKIVVFGPGGKKLGQYVKAKSLWHEDNVKGEARPLLIDTPYGTLAFVIGFDMDFPTHIRHAGDADILLAPSTDWKTLSPHHGLMATFRGIENGLSVFRPADAGVSFASDSHGRILARSDQLRTADQIFFADIPTAGVTTLYTRAGNWFGWFNVALLLLLLLIAYLAARKRKKRQQDGGGAASDDDRDRSRITAIQWREAERDNNLHRNN